jgi:prophage maintenance system killer protein
MANLHYLTVQDLLWINLQATKKVQHFNYARLEEATFYQYAYGDSSSLVPQAARFLPGFIRMHPFDAGNESTALIACATFLRMNGSVLNVPDADAEAWLDKVMTKQISGQDAVANFTEPIPHFHDVLKPDVRSVSKSVLDNYKDTLESLSHRTPSAK